MKIRDLIADLLDTANDLESDILIGLKDENREEIIRDGDAFDIKVRNDLVILGSETGIRLFLSGYVLLPEEDYEDMKTSITVLEDELDKRNALIDDLQQEIDSLKNEVEERE